MTNGRVYVEKTYEIPEAARTSKGRNIVNLLNLQKNEKIAAVLIIDSFESEDSIVLMHSKGRGKEEPCYRLQEPSERAVSRV